MSGVTLQEIIRVAQQESAKMRHFYMGVEHLFIALTKFDGGVTTSVFEENGLSSRFLRYATREAIGRGDDVRYWPGIRVSPRADAVINEAQNAIARGYRPEDRALLAAILQEDDNIPVRVLRESSIDLDKLRQSVMAWTGILVDLTLHIPIEIHAPADDPDPTLSDEQRDVLEHMFREAEAIHVLRFLSGYSGSKVLLVQPVSGDFNFAPVIVKIDDRQAIQYEKLRYDQWVKDILPPTTARIIDPPTLPEHSVLGGIKYTFVKWRGANAPVNLGEYSAQHPVKDLCQFLRDTLYQSFLPYWWGQRKPYRFEVWQEYELLLPPALVLEALPQDASTPMTRTLKPLGPWGHEGGVRLGETIILENFVVQKVDREKRIVQLAAGAASEAINRASRVELHNVDIGEHTYFRGEPIKRMIGRVTRTRDDLLQAQVQALEPDFNILDDYLLGGRAAPGLDLPNPLRRYVRLLDERVSGTLSPIHGDLHLGNILMGPGGDAWLIDFEWTRQGHTLFDWAVLEISLLADMLVPLLNESWDDCWGAIRLIDGLNRRGEIPPDAPRAIADALAPIQEVRGIVYELLADQASWTEYFIALALCAIRVPSWRNRPLGARRLMFLVSALSIDFTHSPDAPTGGRTQIDTVTDFSQLDS